MCVRDTKKLKAKTKKLKALAQVQPVVGLHVVAHLPLRFAQRFVRTPRLFGRRRDLAVDQHHTRRRRR